MQLADWAECNPADRSWDQPVPYGDLSSALEFGPVLAAGVANGAQVERFTVADIAAVSKYRISYHGGPAWKPGDDDGTELEMILYGQLLDGRWFSITAWNDYTGWGCEDDSQVRVAPDEGTILRHGLDKEGREALGVELGD